MAEARIPILDWGFLHSDATYEVVHVWHGAFFRLADHLDRFERGVTALHMALPVGREELAAILHACVAKAGLRDAYVEMVCTRGLPTPGSRDPRTAVNRLYAFAIPFVWILPPERADDGLRLVVSAVERIRPEAVDPRVKNYHWLDFGAGLYEAYARGAETAVLTDDAGRVIEGPGFNLFVGRGGTLATPERGVLEGVTRRTIMELAQTLGIGLAVRPVSADELRTADEAFVTSTAGGVMPISAVDGSALGDGRTGPLTRRLRDAYWALHADPRYATPIHDGSA